MSDTAKISSTERVRAWRARQKAKAITPLHETHETHRTVPTWLEPVLTDRELAGKVQEVIRKHHESQDAVLPVLAEVRQSEWLSDGDLVEVLKYLRSEVHGTPLVKAATRYNRSLRSC